MVLVNDANDLKRQRDRFLAFSFASADLFVEIGADEHIVYTLGAARSLAGASDEGLKGRHWCDMFSQAEHTQLTAMLRRARDGQRCGPLVVTMDESIAGGRRAIVTGIRMPGSDHFYVTIGFSNALMDKLASEIRATGEFELLDKDSFLQTSKEALEIARAVGQDFDMTLVEIGKQTAIDARFGEQAADFKDRVTALLAGQSVDGQSVAETADGQFTVIHGHTVAAEQFQQQIEALFSEFPGAGDLPVSSKTISAELDTLTDREATKALIYTVNEFERKGVDMNIDTLNTGFKAYVSANAHKIVQFKNIVSQFDFDFAFQPIVNLTSGDLSHYEMLCRFRAAGSTEDWIVFGEDIGMAPDLDIAICERAINFLLYKSANSRDRFAVNLSGQSMQNEPFFRTLMAKLSMSSELSSRLVFEITESTTIQDLQTVNSYVRALQDAGFKVCLDDFGSGSASFQYLQQLQVDYVKIDGAYTQRILESPRDAALVRNMAQMCKDLGIYVVAERIEVGEEARMLQGMGVGYGQGYFFSKPRPKPDYEPKVSAADPAE